MNPGSVVKTYGRGTSRGGNARHMGDCFMPTGFGQLKVFSGSAHPLLAREIADYLGIAVGQARLRRFPDTECSFQIDENIRGTDVYIVQPTSAPVDEHLVELMIMIDAFRRSSAARITAVIPYYGYARQDRKDKPRVPISAKLVANVLSAAGTNRVLTMDLHKAQIQAFFDIPVDHLFAAPVIIEYLSRRGYPDLTIVSPDAGGAERARAYAKRLGAELAVIDKRRTEDGTAEVMNVIGDVEGRTCIIQDDIIDTAGTIQKAAHALKANGAARVLACAVHGVLSGPAIKRIEESPLDELIVTNTIPLTPERERCSKIKVLSVARLLGQAIRSIHEETSVSSLFV
jgi:ribose-phosphate pyrophosphokinase